MGKMEDVLKVEISRLARKELRATVDPLARELRKLRRNVAGLSKAVARLDKTAQLTRDPRASKAHLEAPKDEVKAARISPKVIKNLRKKLGVNQETLALLVDVSPGAVAAWEQKRALPRGKNKAALVALRKCGRRDVKRMLADKGVPGGGKKK